MDRYSIFRALMNFFAEQAVITDASMRDYSDRIKITAKSGNQVIEMLITMSEEEPNAEEV